MSPISFRWHPVMLSIILSILVCAAASLFCACLVSVQVCIICHSWQHTGVVHMSLQADGKVAFEDISLCLAYAAQPAVILHCISLSWFFSSRLVHVPFNIFYQHIVHVQLTVVYNHHLYLCDVHLKTHSSTFII